MFLSARQRPVWTSNFPDMAPRPIDSLPDGAPEQRREKGKGYLPVVW
jgi:hypothetical protein